MGYQLYRMIRDGAPATWTGPMIHVAQAIADDARDPDGTQTGPPWSALPIQGYWDSHGRWRDGLTERTGMSARAISRALGDLAAAGYDMRKRITTDKRGRAVYAVKGHAVSFRVPPLAPRPEPVKVAKYGELSLYRSPSTASIDSQRSPSTATKVAKYGDPISSQSPHRDLSPHADQSPPALAKVLDGSLEVTPGQPETADKNTGDGSWAIGRPSPRTTQETADEQRRQAEALNEWMRQHPEAAS
jgi:hypothetical protein